MTLSYFSGKKQVFERIPEGASNRVRFDLISSMLVDEFDAFAFDHGDDKSRISIAAFNPEHEELNKFLREKFGENFTIYRAEQADIEATLCKAEISLIDEIAPMLLVHGGKNGQMVKIVDALIRRAITSGASDVHVEPLRHETAVRFRVDGMLHTMVTIPQDLHPALVARLKILANMKIDEYRRPQDGRIEPKSHPQISLRMNTVPTLYGEKIAIRVLNDEQKKFNLTDLGFSPEHQIILQRHLEKPFGMIVTSGPTGSGKTTTLYGLLSLIRRDGINISTLEDPIEYALAGANQIQINPHAELTFTSGLRALLRQDPDVIMVGEIRDSDTVIMASSAALTGHLVFTTIHTNDAPSVFTRFLEMKVDDFVVSSIVNLVIAQRLVRKICDNCATEEKLPQAILDKISERPDIVSALAGAGKNPEQTSKSKFRHGKGCESCLNTGYKGRIGLFELMELNREIHDLIFQHPTAERIKEAALKSGFQDMIHDGIRKILAGQTTFEEVIRTTKSS